MILLDENYPSPQRNLLLTKGLKLFQIGEEIRVKGIKDDEIIPLLLRQTKPTFITLDQGFFDRRSCHPSYCILIVEATSARIAALTLRLLRDARFRSYNTRAGNVLRVSEIGIAKLSSSSNSRILLPWTI